MKLFVIPNYSKSKTQEVMDRLSELAGKCSFELIGCGDAAGVSHFSHAFSSESEALAACDIVVPVGGDGTILHNAKRAVLAGKPVLGINTGRLGFLCALNSDSLDCLKALDTGDYRIQERMLLDVSLSDGRKFLAFNDATVSRGGNARIIDALIYCEGSPVVHYRADGVIFSTPSGSTAYAMSAGGPLVDPLLRLIEMTPVCPHSLYSRSMLFSAEKTLSLRVPDSEKERSAFLSVDGEVTVPLTPDTEVQIRVSEYSAKMIHFGQDCFFRDLKNMQGLEQF